MYWRLLWHFCTEWDRFTQSSACHRRFVGEVLLRQFCQAHTELRKIDFLSYLHPSALNPYGIQIKIKNLNLRNTLSAYSARNIQSQIVKRRRIQPVNAADNYSRHQNDEVPNISSLRKPRQRSYQIVIVRGLDDWLHRDSLSWVSLYRSWLSLRRCIDVRLGARAVRAPVRRYIQQNRWRAQNDKCIQLALVSRKSNNERLCAWGRRTPGSVAGAWPEPHSEIPYMDQWDIFSYSYISDVSTHLTVQRGNVAVVQNRGLTQASSTLGFLVVSLFFFQH